MEVMAEVVSSGPGLGCADKPSKLRRRSDEGRKRQLARWRLRMQHRRNAMPPQQQEQQKQDQEQEEQYDQPGGGSDGAVLQSSFPARDLLQPPPLPKHVAPHGTSWADEDLGDDHAAKFRFESAADEDGVKDVIEYEERDGKVYKITKRIKTVRQVQLVRARRGDLERKTMAKFGNLLAQISGASSADWRPVTEEVSFDFPARASPWPTLDESEDKFFENSVLCEESFFASQSSATYSSADLGSSLATHECQ